MKNFINYFFLWLNKTKNYEHYLEVEYKKDFFLLEKMGIVDIKNKALMILSRNI